MRKNIGIILLLATILIVPACSLLTGEDQTKPGYVSGKHPQLTFSPAELPAAEVGKPYEVRIDVGNVDTFVGQFEAQEGQLPPGLVFERVKSENAVKINGVPEAEGVYPFVLFVQCMGTNDPGQEGKMKYSIEVKASQ